MRDDVHGPLNRCTACGAPAAAHTCPACGFAPPEIDGFRCHAPALANGGAGYDAAHYHVLAELEAGNFWFRARNQLIVAALRKHAGNMRRLLEIGCGTGFVLRGIREAFPDTECTGSEVFVEGLRHAAPRLPGVRLVQMDAREIPATGSFDAIGAFDVIEHIDDDRRVLAEIHRALAPGGTMVLTVPQHAWLWSAQDEIAHHVRRYSRRELVGKVRAAGFEVVQATSFVTLLLPLMMLSRLRRTDPRAPVDPFREFRIPKWMNALLLLCMQADLAAIRLGLSLPVGGSLLVVARKGNAR
jgi:SAM-dependent methyltransferase